MEIESFEKEQKLDRDIKYKGIVIGNVSQVSSADAQINIHNLSLINRLELPKEVSKLADMLIYKGFRTVILVYNIFYIKSLRYYFQNKFIETGNHPMIARGWIPGIPGSNPILRSFVIDMLARRRTGSTDFQDIIDRYQNLIAKFSVGSQILFNINKWIKYSLYEIKIANEQDPDSYVSNVLNIAYPISKRPPTSMSAIARSLGSIKTIKLNQPNTTGRPIAMEINKKLEHLIPVTRYSYGVEKGGYFNSDKKQDYCGTFYYWEPSSNIYLIMGKNAYYPNKIAALLALGPKNEKLQDLIEEFTMIAESNNLVDRNLDFKVKYKELLFNPDTIDVSKIDYKIKYDELVKLLISDEIMTSSIYSFDNFFNTKDDKYIGNLFYAREDVIDQQLCIAGKKAGLDTIIFSRMPSSRRIVTELLDTRNRQDSLNNLVWELQ